ncbi:MAG: hypothetical protein Q8P91_01475 [bacterium]|nr:hypothetical protein [bacterium]
MPETEKQSGRSSQNNIEIIARFLLGQIKKEDMDGNSRAVLSYGLGLMADNPVFRNDVYSRKDELEITEKNGRKIPLYTDDELAKARRHRKKKITSFEKAFQPGLFNNSTQSSEITGIEIIQDPERRLVELHNESQSRFSRNKNSLIAKEIQQKKMKLRDIIGLPVARGKDEHINDGFYKFLVRRVVKFDTFGVFGEFDRTMTETHPELEMKINQVKGLVGELLNGGQNLRERYQKFHQFSEEFKEKWGE